MSAAGLLPPELLERYRALRQAGVVPSPCRDAATVVLLRDSPVGPQVYLQRRVTAMAFAAGMHVFPGGSVDPADAEAHVRWAGPSAAQWAEVLGSSEPLARALVCAAVRETFEESGVLLAGPFEGELLADVSTDDWEAERVALEAREQSLSQLLDRRGLVLRTDLLRPLAHWITPEVEPKRFDTRFFLAQLPDGQVCRDVGGEADDRVWIRPQQALDQQLPMLPPTTAALRDLTGAEDVRAALAAPRTIAAIMPVLVQRGDDGLALVLPDDPDYPA